MTPSSSPYSQTGLLPTTHKQQRDLQSCIDNWKRLAPRPPPELYPFKGDYVHQKRKENSKQPRYLTKEKLVQQQNIDSTRLNIGSREKRQWIPFQNDLTIHQYEPAERQKFDSSRMNSLDFIRKSAVRRELLLQYEQQLEMDLAREGLALTTDSIPQLEKNSILNQNNLILQDILKLKTFMREITEQDEKDDRAQIVTGEVSSDQGAGRIITDQTDTMESEICSTYSDDDEGIQVSPNGISCLQPYLTQHEENGITPIPELKRGILNELNAMQRSTNSRHLDSTSSEKTDPIKIKKTDCTEGYIFKSFASAIADGILATISNRSDK